MDSEGEDEKEETVPPSLLFSNLILGDSAAAAVNTVKALKALNHNRQVSAAGTREKNGESLTSSSLVP